MTYLTTMLSRLPSMYNKDTAGNIGKLFTIVADQMEDVKTALQTIKSWRDIDSAEGTALDRIGKNIGQLRGNLNDVTYRLLLKIKIAADISKGDVDTMIEITAALFNIDVKEVKLDEVYPAGIKIELPYNSIDSALITNFDTIKQFIKLPAAGGVSVEIDLIEVEQMEIYFAGVVRTGDYIVLNAN